MLRESRRRSSFAAIAVGIGAIAAGCAPGTSDPAATTAGPGGGDGDGDGGSTSPSSTAAPSSTADTAASTSTGDATGGAGSVTSSSGDGGAGQGGDVDTGGGTGVGGEGGEGGEGGASPECEVAQNCPDPNDFCIARTCDDGVCGEVPVALGTPLPNVDQTQGDCRVVVCDGAGDATDQDDDLDFIEDADPCTIELCSDGDPVTEPAELGVACGTDLACDGEGNCVGCITADDCPGEDDECRTRVCSDAGECAPTFADAGTELAEQAAGDCQELQCDGNGTIISVDADGDVPPPEEDCVAKICVDGAPAEEDVGSGAICDEDGGVLCDGSGACVECLTVAQCPADTPCATYACTSGECVADFADAGTFVADPQPGDCRNEQCDGGGGIVEDAVADTDLPVDASECTSNQCNSGTPLNPALSVNTPCNQNGGTRCNGLGVCVECTAPAQCQSNVCTNGQCVAAACNDGVLNGNETGLDCGGPDCANCPNGRGCDTGDDCISGFCNPNTSLCAAPVCNDGYANGAETDVDCGGGLCPDCALGFACDGDFDCLSNYCLDGFCSTFFCGDGTANPGEDCDDGDEIDFNGCDNDCGWTCGNGLLNSAQGEICEDGDHDSGDGCSSTCGIEASYQCNTAVPSVCIRQEVRCNNGINDDGDLAADGADPDCSFFNDGQIAACPAGSTLYLYNGIQVPLAIPDNNVTGVTSRIWVPNIGLVKRVTMRMSITHTYDADLTVSLISPTNVTRRAVALRGGGGDNFTLTRFVDAAATAISAGTAPFTNQFRPEDAFTTFNDTASQGFWNLRVVDSVGVDTGSLTRFELAICAQ
jgi:subtilisin-like proprotein convertase family protein